MDVSKKSLGFLIDELSVVNIRSWFAQDDIMNPNLSEKERLDAAIRAQKMNARRNALIRAIDERLGEGAFSAVEKSYE